MKRDIWLSGWYGTEEAQSKGGLDNISIKNSWNSGGYFIWFQKNWDKSFFKAISPSSKDRAPADL